MTMLGRKLRRDLWHMRGQVVTIALVLAVGVAALISITGTYRSLGAAAFGEQDIKSDKEVEIGCRHG